MCSIYWRVIVPASLPEEPMPPNFPPQELQGYIEERMCSVARAAGVRVIEDDVRKRVKGIPLLDHARNEQLIALIEVDIRYGRIADRDVPLLIMKVGNSVRDALRAACDAATLPERHGHIIAAVRFGVFQMALEHVLVHMIEQDCFDHP